MSRTLPSFCGYPVRTFRHFLQKTIYRGVSIDKETKKVIAVFRFGVIADFVGERKLSRGEKELILREKS
ncbi:MAG: hypothetical protein WCQ90_07350 [Deltaproteobacteria bacterium]